MLPVEIEINRNYSLKLFNFDSEHLVPKLYKKSGNRRKNNR